MPTQLPSDRLRALHAGPGPVLLGAAWDVGTGRLAAHLGYPGIDTSSAGLAFSTGRPDAAGLLTRGEIVGAFGAIARAVDVPVNADLENGFGDDPDTVAETMRQASAAGLAGGSIEDATGRADRSLYALPLAVARVRAAVQAAAGGLMITARCDAFMHGHHDLNEVIVRLRAYQDAGADCLMAPGLPDRDAVRAVVAELHRPVALVVGLGTWRPNMAELAEIGVRRVSVGSGTVRTAFTAYIDAAREALESGTFTRVAAATPFGELNGLFRELNSR